MGSRISRCGLVNFPPDLLQAFAGEEVERSLGVSLIASDLRALATNSLVCDVWVCHVTEASYVDVLDGVRKAIAADTTHQQHFIFTSPQLLDVDLVDAWDLGLYAYVPVGQHVDNLYHVLNRLARERRESDMLVREIREASDIAVLSMSASSQLGDVVRFMERSFQAADNESLAGLLDQTLSVMEVRCCGQISGEEGITLFGDEAMHGRLDRSLVQHAGEGVSEGEDFVLLQCGAVALLVTSLPEAGSEPHARLKDVLASLVEGAAARVAAIASARSAERMESIKQAFLSVMSHELRTPMNAILGFANRLRTRKEGDVISARDQAAIGFLLENAQRLMGMIENMFELTRIEPDPDKARRRFLLDEVLMGIIKRFEAAALARGLTYHWQWQVEDACVDLDPGRLQQILLQLLDNAVKYTTSGEVSVSVSCPAEAGVPLSLRVSDSGPGIPEAVRHVMHQPLGNVEDYLSRGGQGVHMGLSLVVKFVADLKGTLDINTSPQGTVVSVLLPRNVLPENAALN